VPKSKVKGKKQISRVKKYELEKKTLLIMEQMVSQISEFTNKNRYFDYKKISSNITAYNIPAAECKKIWESFKSRLRGQLNDNEEMRECRDQWNEDYYTYHNMTYTERLDIYNKNISHPEIISDLKKLTQIWVENQFSVHNELLELNENQEKLLSVLYNFDRVIKTSDDHEELDQLEADVQNLRDQLESHDSESEDASKRKYKCKDETELFNKIMSRVYHEEQLELPESLKLVEVRPEKKPLSPVEGLNKKPIHIPLLKPLNSNESKAEDTGDDPEMLYYSSLIQRNMKIFKITKNASKDDSSWYDSKNGGRRCYRRRRINEDGESEYYSDSSYYDVIPPKIMYGTINTIYKDYI
jgi:hypothetical protein